MLQFLGGYRTWFPKLHEHLIEEREKLDRRVRGLEPPLAGSAWTACTCNLGPRTVCWQHRDHQDYVRNVSGTLALGRFDGSRGGHLILHEARLVIRMDPGDILIFPSACITHQNLPIAEGETRRSLVLYSAGGLVRYAEQGYCSRKKLEKTRAGRAKVKELDEGGEERWLAGWKMYSTLAELRSLYGAVGGVVGKSDGGPAV